MTAVTKLVEWPVEDKVPALSDVLYNGHSYMKAGLSESVETDCTEGVGSSEWMDSALLCCFCKKTEGRG